MTTFVGFNTIGQTKKFTLVDFELVKRDFLNALNIKQGQLVGRPGYGTTIWNYLFENQTQATERAILAEMQRVAKLDPRIYIQSADMYPQENGILVELELMMVPGQTTEFLSVYFDQETVSATYA
jgi:phage baseplate assembly protein W|tara:strand:+ start:4166 stop:4540 length:375 start_codon:yes stop_codon:yes gene_type:complete